MIIKWSTTSFFALLFAASLLCAVTTVAECAPYVTEAADINVVLSPRNNNINGRNSTLSFAGGDVDLSVDLNGRYTLFLYGDTLLGKWDEVGQRVCDTRFPATCFDPANVPHSTVSIWDKSTQQMTYFWRTTDADPSFLLPPWQTATTQFWGTALTPPNNDTLCIFGVRVEQQQQQQQPSGQDDGNVNPLSFTMQGSYVVCLDGVRTRPTDPLSWAQRWASVPGSGQLPDGGDIEWRSAVYVPETSRKLPTDYVYVFGEVFQPQSNVSYDLTNKTYRQILGRISWVDLMSLNMQNLAVYSPSSATYVSNQAFYLNPMQAVLWDTAIPEFTVQPSTATGLLFVVHFESRWSTRICLSTASLVEGPWNTTCGNDPASTTNTPIVGQLGMPFSNTSEMFCYALKVHSSLAYLMRPAPAATAASGADSACVEERFVFSFVCNAWNPLTLFTPPDGDKVYVAQYRVLHLANNSACTSAAEDDGLGDVSGQMRTVVILVVCLALAMALTMALLVTVRERRQKDEVTRHEAFDEEPAMSNYD